MAMTTWEQRMSQRAQVRMAAERDRILAEQQAEIIEKEQREQEESDKYFKSMTKEEAQAISSTEPWACACIGGPRCCIKVRNYANRLLGN